MRYFNATGSYLKREYFDMSLPAENADEADKAIRASFPDAEPDSIEIEMIFDATNEEEEV